MCVGLGLILLVSAALVVSSGPVFVLHCFVLLCFFFKDLRNTQTALRRQVTDVAHHLPHFVVFQDAFPAWHPGRTDSVLDDPFQLAICVFLNIFRSEVGDRGFHLLRKGNARVLTIKTMADLAVMLEVFRSLFHRISIVRRGILRVLPADGDIMLDSGDYGLFDPARLSGFASCE